jgi:hypothetical protein
VSQANLGLMASAAEMEATDEPRSDHSGTTRDSPKALQSGMNLQKSHIPERRRWTSGGVGRSEGRSVKERVAVSPRFNNRHSTVKEIGSMVDHALATTNFEP